DAEANDGGVLGGEAVRQPRAATTVEAHPSFRGVGEMNADDRELAVVCDALRELRPGPREPVGAEGERAEGRLEEQAAVEPLVHAPALHHAVPPPDLATREAGADPAGRLHP